jgi:hypothetical protein
MHDPFASADGETGRLTSHIMQAYANILYATVELDGAGAGSQEADRAMLRPLIADLRDDRHARSRCCSAGLPCLTCGSGDGVPERGLPRQSRAGP